MVKVALMREIRKPIRRKDGFTKGDDRTLLRNEGVVVERDFAPRNGRGGGIGIVPMIVLGGKRVGGK